MFLESFRVVLNLNHLITCDIVFFDMTKCNDVIYFNVYIYSLLFVLVFAFAVAALGCNVLCQICFMLSIAMLLVTPYALHDDC